MVPRSKFQGDTNVPLHKFQGIICKFKVKNTKSVFILPIKLSKVSSHSSGRFCFIYLLNFELDGDHSGSGRGGHMTCM